MKLEYFWKTTEMRVFLAARCNLSTSKARMELTDLVMSIDRDIFAHMFLNVSRMQGCEVLINCVANTVFLHHTPRHARACLGVC